MRIFTAEAPRGMVVIVGAVIAVVLGFAIFALLPDREEAASEPTPLQQVLREINPDGTWSEETALRAFSAVFGPLPGVVVPEGPEADVEFGTIAMRMLSLYIDEISAEQRQAALDAAGPLAKYLDPDAESNTTVRTMGLADPTIVLAADADTYQAQIQSIITSLESRIGRPLGIDFEVVVSPDPAGILHATAEATTDDGENITGCEITILPNAQALSGKNLTAVLAHEVWHCFEYSRLGLKSRVKNKPPWIIEGQAMWVGEAFVGGSDGLEPADRHWKEYLIDPGPGTGLFARAYDAIGFYSHLHDQGIDPWTVLDPVLDQTSNLAAFGAAVGAKGLDVVTTWAPSWYRDGAPTSTFSLVNAPGIPAAGVRPAPSTFTISDGTFQQVSALDPLSAALADVGIDAEVLTIDVMGQAVVGDMTAGEEIIFVANNRTFCMIGDCTCPDGSPGPGDRLGNQIRVAVTGDALIGSDALLRGWSLLEWCDQEESPPPPGSGAGAGSPCQGGCGSSNGDPHLTTIDGRSYDFQAAGEFVMLRSDEIEIQARQEPYPGSNAVTINTAVAVGAGDGRAVVYADQSGLRLTIDGVEAALGESTSVGAMEITPIADGVQFTTPNGTVVSALSLGEWGVNIVVAPSPDLRADGTGLLAATGSGPLPALPDGSDVDAETDYLAALYTDLANAWEVTGETTLFDYEDGSGPESFRDRAIPEPGAPIDFFDLSEVLRDFGLAECGAITDAALLIQCAFDVAVADDPGFVASYESVDEFVTTGPEDELGAMTGGQLEPLVVNMGVIAGSALDEDGTLYISIRHQDQTRELVAIDPAAQTVLTRTDLDFDGQIAVVAGSVWMSTSTEDGCSVRRFDPDLAPVGSVAVECIISLFAPQLVAAGGAPWVYDGEPALRRIDPESLTLGDDVPLPFPNGYLRSTGDTVFYSDIAEEGVYRLSIGDGDFEKVGTGQILVQPGGEGLWEPGADSISYYTDDAAPTATVATDGTLVGAIGNVALVERLFETGPELWAYPADGGAPVPLSSGPTIGSGSEERVLHYFDNDPPLIWNGHIVKLWVEPARSGDAAPSLFAQAIPPPE